MDNSQIHHLLAKYFEGYTTLDEEKILLDFFSGLQEDEAEWRPVKKQFELIRAGRDISFDTKELELKILNRIDEYEKIVNPPVIKKRSIYYYLAAASVALAITLSGIILFKSGSNETKDTFSDPQIAYMETRKTLLYVSQKMNEGIQPLTNVSKINSGTDQLKNLEKIDKSLDMLNLVSFINQTSNLKK